MEKVAVVILSDMESHSDRARVFNALETVKELKEAGDQVELIFDGGGVVSAAQIADPAHDFHFLYSKVADKVTGVCRMCSRSFNVHEQVKEYGLPFLAEYDQHPSIRRLIVEGNHVLTF